MAKLILPGDFDAMSSQIEHQIEAASDGLIGGPARTASISSEHFHHDCKIVLSLEPRSLDLFVHCVASFVDDGKVYLIFGDHQDGDPPKCTQNIGIMSTIVSQTRLRRLEEFFKIRKHFLRSAFGLQEGQETYGEIRMTR